MLGAVLKATGALALKDLNVPLEERFGRLAIKNMKALKRAYDGVKMAQAA
jgi:pyruvate ferredoxin oxidoreductase gamma subunit